MAEDCDRNFSKMSDFELSGLIDLDVSEMTGGADDASEALDGLADQSDDTSESLMDLDSQGLAVAAGLGAAGSAAGAALSNTQDLRESLERTATTTGMTSDEIRDLTTDLSDATFSTDDVAGSLDAFAQQGVETERELRDLAETADLLADATDTSATSVAENLGPAVQALDGDLSSLEENADTFTVAVRNSTLETEDLGRVIERSSEDLQEMGVQSDEAAQMIAAYADATGKSGTRASRDFSQAINQTDGDVEALKDELGLTEAQIEQFSGGLEENQGAAEDHAAAVADTRTATDRLGAVFDDVMLQAGGFLQPVSALAPALHGLAGAQALVSTVNLSALAPSFATVSAAAAPFTLAVLGLAAAGGLLFAVFGDDLIPMLEQFATDALDTVMSELGPVIDEFQKTASVLSDTFAPAFETTEAAVTPPVEAIGSVVETQFAIVTDVLEGIAILLRGDFEGAWEAATDTIGDLTEDMIDELPSAADARDAIDGFIDGVVDGIADRIPDVTGAVEDMTGEIREFLPFSPAERGPLSDLDESGESLPATLAAGVESNSGTVAGATGSMAGQASTGSGGLSASAIRSALEGMALSLSGGQLDLDGDVATLRDVEARLERAGREAELRGTQ